MKILLVKTENGFVPAYDSDKECADKIGLGEMREFQTYKNRNLKHHRKYFAILRLALEALPEKKQQEAMDFGFGFHTEEDMLFYIKMKLGMYEERMVLSSGKIAVKEKSISFKNMGQDEFNKFYERSLVVISNLTGLDVETIENEHYRYM